MVMIIMGILCLFILGQYSIIQYHYRALAIQQRFEEEHHIVNDGVILALLKTINALPDCPPRVTPSPSVKCNVGYLQKRWSYDWSLRSLEPCLILEKQKQSQLIDVRIYSSIRSSYYWGFIVALPDKKSSCSPELSRRIHQAIVGRYISS
jgi:hypothetical protein